jgi:hypothetical protein
MWDKILTFLVHILSSAESDILAFLLASAKAIEQSGGQALILAATTAVKAAEATGGSGADKFAAAKDSVLQSLQSQGIAAIEGAVNAGIEAAVAQMKANQAADAAQPAA